MALLFWATTNLWPAGIDVVAVNIDHSLRRYSARDTLFVREYCAAHNINCFYKTAEKGEIARLDGASLEDKARRFRYAFFDELIRDGKVDKISTAHHASDNAETVFLHLLRGSGLRGVRGINPVGISGIIRPMLDVGSEDIDAYIASNNIPFVVDETNKKPDMSRNLVRNRIFPMLKKRGFDPVAALNGFSELAEADDNCLNGLVPKLTLNKNEVLISDKYYTLHPSILSRTILRALELLSRSTDISRKNIDSIIALMREGATGSSIDIKRGLTAVKDYAGVSLISAVSDNSTYGLEKLSAYITAPALRADKEKIPKTAVWRTRQPGDMFKKFGGCTVKLKEYFIDKKIPSRLREYVPVLCDGSDVLCVLGFEISDSIKTTPSTKDTLELTWHNTSSDIGI